MPDPVSRLEMVRQEVDRTFGVGFAAQHPELVAAVMATAASDYMAVAITRGLQDIAAALVTEEETVPHNGSGLVRAQGGLVRP